MNEFIGGSKPTGALLAKPPDAGPPAPAAARRRVKLGDVAVVAPSLHWNYSGITATIIALAPRQARDVPIASLGPFLPPEVPQIRFRDLLLHGWSRPAGFRYRIWHARRNNEMILGVLLKHLLRQPWKLVFTSAAQRPHSPLTRWLTRRMDGLIATSNGAAACLELPATVIHHGVDISRFRPAENGEEASRNAGLPGALGVGAFGRVRPQKGTDLVVEAMIRLLPKYPDAFLVLTGKVDAKHKRFAADLKRRVAVVGLQDRILFLGEAAAEDMPEWFRRVRLYVAPMRSEGFGITPLEAMASATAVVATRTGAAPQLVQDGVTGVLVPSDDLEALVAAIEPFLAEPSRAEEMGRRGRDKAVRCHDVDHEAARINEVYRRLWSACESKPDNVE